MSKPTIVLVHGAFGDASSWRSVFPRLTVRCAATSLAGPGVVGRCRSCDNVLIVITQRRGMYCVDLGGLSRIETPPLPAAPVT